MHDPCHSFKKPCKFATMTDHYYFRLECKMYFNIISPIVKKKNKKCNQNLLYNLILTLQMYHVFHSVLTVSKLESLSHFGVGGTPNTQSSTFKYLDRKTSLSRAQQCIITAVDRLNITTSALFSFFNCGKYPTSNMHMKKLSIARARQYSDISILLLFFSIANAKPVGNCQDKNL